MSIRTWQERTGNHNIRPGSVKHMIAEIAELRAELARRSIPQGDEPAKADAQGDAERAAFDAWAVRVRAPYCDTPADRKQQWAGWQGRAAAAQGDELPPLPMTWQKRYFGERVGRGTQQMMMEYMEAEIAQWREYGAACRAGRAKGEDAERLDWLESSARTFCGNKDYSGFRMIGSEIWHGTLREAIDAARSNQTGGKE